MDEFSYMLANAETDNTQILFLVTHTDGGGRFQRWLFESGPETQNFSCQAKITINEEYRLQEIE